MKQVKILTPVQKKIVAHLDTLSEKITTLRTHQAQTALEKSVLHKAFQEGLG